MRAAFWWIDRWRQSRAFTDMTAEEQGLYRNLLDEVWLRDDHVIPDEPRILAKVSGDPEAWSRCGAKVLQWMTRVPSGWTQGTALEVIGQAKVRAEKQKRYRDKSRNGDGNDQGNASGDDGGNQAGSPSPSPSPEKKQKTKTDPRPAPATAVARVNWVSEACDDYCERFGPGSAKAGKISGGIAPVVKALAASLHETHAAAWSGSVRPAWRRYLAESRHIAPNAADFAEHFANWTVATVNGALVPTHRQTAARPDLGQRQGQHAADWLAAKAAGGNQ